LEIFQDSRHMKVGRLSARCTPGNIRSTHKREGLCQ